MSAPAEVREAIVRANWEVAYFGGRVRGAYRWVHAWLVLARAYRAEGDAANEARCRANSAQLGALAVVL